MTGPAPESRRPPRRTPDAVSLPGDWASRQPAVRRALTVVLALNIVVVCAKLSVGVTTGSLTVLGAALESGLDLLNLVIGMILVSVAARAPDEDHPYGHDKFESLGTLVIVGFLSISCFELLREAVGQLVHRAAPLHASRADVAVLAGAAAVNLLVVWFERRRGRALDSAFLLADAAHASSDFYVTALAVTSLALALTGRSVFDAPFAILVAVLIARNGYIILRGSVPVLVDQRAVDATRIRRLVGDVPRVSDVRVVRSRATGSGLLFAEVTIGVAAATTVADAHAIADAVEAKIRQALGAAEVTVHVEPA
jgi:cation diffusion facilitator family transporter